MRIGGGSTSEVGQVRRGGGGAVRGGEVKDCLGSRQILKVSTGEVSRGEGKVLQANPVILVLHRVFQAVRAKEVLLDGQRRTLGQVLRAPILLTGGLRPGPPKGTGPRPPKAWPCGPLLPIERGPERLQSFLGLVRFPLLIGVL